MPLRLNRTFFCLAAWLFYSAAVFAGPIEPEAGGIIDLPHLADPKLVVVKADRTFHPQLEGLWLKALAQPDPSLRRQAIEAFAKAHAQGMNVSPQTRDAIQQRLRDDDSAQVRLSSASAMMQFDQRAAAADIFALNQQSAHPMVTPLLDDILAAWDHPPARKLWRERASDAQGPHAVRRSAIRSLGIVADRDSRDLLLQLTRDPAADTDLRLVAAEALGRVASAGLVEPATRLSREKTPGALLAVRMLVAHDDDAALTLLEQLTNHDDHAVAAAAARRLATVAPQRISPQLANHDDPQVRLSATRAAATSSTHASILLLSDRLNDPSVSVRTLARDTLIAWADDASLRPMIELKMQQLWPTTDWRGREQVALICGWINDKSAADRFVLALRDDRAEVRLAVCAALRQLQVSSTAGAMTARVAELTEPPPEDQPYDSSRSFEATQLILALGTMNAREAELVFRKMIPKGSPPSSDARAAAIWALGRWHEGQLDVQLASQLVARMSDESPMNPEAPLVRRFSTIALGRMGTTNHLPALQRFSEGIGGDNELAAACRWAIEQITGNPVPAPRLDPVNVTGWFLEPIE